MNLIAAVGAALLALGVLSGCHHRHAAEATARPGRITAPIQRRLDRTTTAAVQRAAARASHTVHDSEEAAHAAEIAPGADAPVPPAVRDGWAAAVDCLRGDAEAARAGRPARDCGRAPAGPLPAPLPPR